MRSVYQVLAQDGNTYSVRGTKDQINEYLAGTGAILGDELGCHIKPMKAKAIDFVLPEDAMEMRSALIEGPFSWKDQE